MPSVDVNRETTLVREGLSVQSSRFAWAVQRLNYYLDHGLNSFFEDPGVEELLVNVLKSATTPLEEFKSVLRILLFYTRFMDDYTGAVFDVTIARNLVSWIQSSGFDPDLLGLAMSFERSSVGRALLYENGCFEAVYNQCTSVSCETINVWDAYTLVRAMSTFPYRPLSDVTVSVARDVVFRVRDRFPSEQAIVDCCRRVLDFFDAPSLSRTA
jgi:hypothetical protein